MVKTRMMVRRPNYIEHVSHSVTLFTPNFCDPRLVGSVDEESADMEGRV